MLSEDNMTTFLSVLVTDYEGTTNQDEREAIESTLAKLTEQYFSQHEGETPFQQTDGSGKSSDLFPRSRPPEVSVVICFYTVAD